MSPYDAIVIGSGQAGPFLAVRLAQSGMKVALVEREHYGGTCVNDGCIPTKTLVASARTAHVARRAAEYGVIMDGSVNVDMKAVMARKDHIVQQSVGSLTQWLQGTAGLDLVRGHARFTGPDAVEVGSRTLTAPNVFINVGGRAVLPDWPGIDSVPVLTNTSIMGLDVLPQHLIVVGGSYIGLEFAQMFRRFGAQVTVLEAADRLIAREDPEVSAEVQAILEREGVRFVLGVRNGRVARRGEQIHVSCEEGGAAHEFTVSHLLAAVGRRPNTDDLGLQAAGIATDPRGFITVDDQLRTNVPGVWALGDVNGRGAFTHTAHNDFEIVAANLLDGGRRSTRDRLPAYALFIDPPLGRVCIEGDEIVHSLLDVMAADASYRVVQRAVHIHPTVSELIPTLLGQRVPLKGAG